MIKEPDPDDRFKPMDGATLEKEIASLKERLKD